MSVKSADVTFVTAIFDLKPDDPIGGRGFPVARYLPSLSSIAALDAPLVVYTRRRHVESIDRFLREHGTRAKIVAASLDELPRFWQVQAVRTTRRVHTLPYRDRCHALCFGKFAWLAAQARAHPFGTTRYFWIDAGLAHEGLFPARHLPRGGGGRCGLFTPSLTASLLEQRLFVLFGLQPVQGTQIHSINLDELSRAAAATDGDAIRTHIVGGLFGGLREDVLATYVDYDAVLAALLERNLLGTEENVLTVLYHRDPARFRLFPFTTWYHEDTDFTQPAPHDIPFYRVIERLSTGA